MPRPPALTVGGRSRGHADLSAPSSFLSYFPHSATPHRGRLVSGSRRRRPALHLSRLRTGARSPLRAAWAHTARARCSPGLKLSSGFGLKVGAKSKVVEQGAPEPDTRVSREPRSVTPHATKFCRRRLFGSTMRARLALTSTKLRTDAEPRAQVPT